MTVRIINADVMEGLAQIESESVQAIVTSPPYWRQRDYGMDSQIGLESTPEEYTEKLIVALREARRVLRNDGTLWLNLGDKWASGGNGGGGKWMVERGHAWDHAKNAKGWRKPPAGYKDKDLVGVPWMVAFALRADGWFLRQCNIWAKPNGMPESVEDRSTVSHEYIFHLSKRNDYFYNGEDARTPAAPSSEIRLTQNVEAQAGSARAHAGGKTNGPMKAVFGGRNKSEGYGTRRASGREDEGKYLERGCNLRSVWWVAPASYSEGHYAVMPDLLAEICIICGSKPGDTILDPFGGAGTTGLVADRLGRNAILIELNPEYAAMAERRIKGDCPMFAEVSA
jgi:DNA modification methylase